ncbi:MAG: hypothetical protein WBL52_04505 [Bacillota bacterium]|jgi:hypothetical protein|nr:hypothetical protein [Candidatus Fermentithermobacillaceae bacterium]HOA71425.1 hypothetical protein [Bacillota bacterium]HPT35640.1 hypothetical protein [Bacillota bacterium]HPZ86012.1 hypothetical protein [Bacillota bacterium]
MDHVLLLELLKFPGLSESDRMIYIRVCITRPGSLKELIAGTGLSRNTVSKSCRRLEQAGWLNLVKNGAKIIPVPTAPKAVKTEQAKSIEHRFKFCAHKGEFLTKHYLDCLVPQRNYIDNARPDFLVYPLTGERLEIDRYFPEEKVGFEFNGPQHYGVTDMYPDEEQFRQRRVRDMFKIGACAEHGVVLTVLTAADLSVGRMRQKIPPRLPQDTVDMDDPVIQTLERLSRHYRRQIEKIEKRAGHGVSGPRSQMA